MTHVVLSAEIGTASCDGPRDPLTEVHVSRTTTPGQSGLPAEFKHINKRRKRNLQGFP